ncbi:MAG: cytoplasmic protein [Deltaproteobacteria bacterium]|nr:cytoplasmic protein [Deltaproteobacteria bacterium]
MEIDLKLDGNNLYREESFTDMKTGAVRRMSPVTSDGSPDESRSPIFIAQTQLMSPEGPLPVSAMLEAGTLAEAVEKFPEAVSREVDRIVEIAQKAKQEDSSRIIVPGQS